MRSFLLSLFFVLTFITVKGESQVKVTKVTDNPPYTGAELEKYCSNPNKLLVIETKLGTMKIQLFDKVAPHHVKQITDLAEDGKYTGTTFHRTIKDFMIQGGDPNSKDDDLSNDGTGGMGDKLNSEFSAISHVRGICSMARTNDPNSATSQFFICHGSPSFLDHQYTVWGQLLSGYDVMDKIIELPHIQGDNPGKAAEMTKVYIQEVKEKAKVEKKEKKAKKAKKSKKKED
jgi:peptidyl-prolyl cis-trans isomerase B (cyclophilin B)